MRNATGLYFKVVDSDDWVDADAYMQILDKLREFVVDGEAKLDMLLSNYVYEKEGAKRKRVMRYDGSMPENRIFTWKEMKGLGLGHYILMHSLIYRTELLRSCGLELPEHTCYVDNIFAFQPFPYVKKLY